MVALLSLYIYINDPTKPSIRHDDSFSAVVDNGIVKALNVEPDGTGYTSSAAECTLKQV